MSNTGIMVVITPVQAAAAAVETGRRARGGDDRRRLGLLPRRTLLRACNTDDSRHFYSFFRSSFRSSFRSRKPHEWNHFLVGAGAADEPPRADGWYVRRVCDRRLLAAQQADKKKAVTTMRNLETGRAPQV